MSWDGQERRKEQRYCDGHLEFSNTLARVEERLIAVDRRINGSIKEVEKHIENSRPRNIAIIGVAVSIFVFLFNLAISLGENHKQIVINTARLERLEQPLFKK